MACGLQLQRAAGIQNGNNPGYQAMLYVILYRKNNETHELEWYAPSYWSAATVRKCFQDRFSEAEIISFSVRDPVQSRP